MASSRKKSKSTKPQAPSIFVPPVAPVAASGLGVAPRLQESAGMRADARLAGQKSDKFPKGGTAFEAWCAERGVHIRDKRQIEFWEELLAEFAERPIHGHRRGPSGGTHRANSSALRR